MVKAAAIAIAVLLVSQSANAQQVEPPPEDAAPSAVETWHQARNAYRIPEEVEGGGRLELGLLPGVGGALGFPDGVQWSGDVFLSLRRIGRWSAFAGYGVGGGPSTSSHAVTLGWGAVRRLPVAGHQMGFNGTFLRYHRLSIEEHGRHQGLTIGTEFGAGWLVLGAEAGAVISSRNHWAPIVALRVKLVRPIVLPLSTR